MLIILYMKLSQLSIAINSICPVDASAQEAIQQIVKQKTLPRGAVLVTEGQITDEVHFIEKGLIRAFYYKGRKEITSWMAHEGRFIWPLPSYLLRQPSPDNIQVLETATILSINRQDLEQLKQRYNVFDALECRIMERYIVLYDFRVRILLLKSEERLEAYRKAFPDLYQRVPLRYIATYLGVDPSTISRVRSGYKIEPKS